MQEKFLKSITGKCSTCGNDLIEGGYIYYNGKDEIEGVKCNACHDIADITKVKKAQLYVEKLYGWFCRKHYKVLSVNNLFMKHTVLTEKEVMDFVIDPNIDIKIKN